jgi:hypothetical protein
MPELVAMKEEERRDTNLKTLSLIRISRARFSAIGDVALGPPAEVDRLIDRLIWQRRPKVINNAFSWTLRV